MKLFTYNLKWIDLLITDHPCANSKVHFLATHKGLWNFFCWALLCYVVSEVCCPLLCRSLLCCKVLCLMLDGLCATVLCLNLCFLYFAVLCIMCAVFCFALLCCVIIFIDIQKIWNLLFKISRSSFDSLKSVNVN